MRLSTRFGIGPTTIVVGVPGPAGTALDRARSGQFPDPVPRRRRNRDRLRDRRLQHHPGQLPAGDLPAAAAGTHELRDALHRLGDDPDRHARRRRPRVLASACARRSWSVRSGAARRSSGSSSRRSATCARCPSRSRMSRDPTELGAAVAGSRRSALAASTSRVLSTAVRPRYNSSHARATRGRGVGARARPSPCRARRSRRPVPRTSRR